MQINFGISHRLWRYSFKNLFSESWNLTWNKSVEFQVIFNSQMLVNFDLEIIFGGRDHAGPEVCLGLFGIELRIGLPDRRHWNREQNRWETDEEMMTQNAKNTNSDKTA